MSFSLGPYLPTIGVVIALGLILAVLYRNHWAASAAGGEPRMKPILPEESGTPHLGAGAEYGRWQADMHDYAREIKGEIDAKMAGLQELIAQARAESERLEGLLAKAQKLKNPIPGDEPRG